MIKSLIYMFRKFRAASLLNLLGLVLAFATSYLLLTQIEYADDYNKSVPGYQRCYRLELRGIFSDSAWCTWVSYNLFQKLLDSPGVEGAAAVSPASSFMCEVLRDGSRHTFPVYETSRESFAFFGLSVLDGSLDSVFACPSIVVTEDIAMRYFGTEMAAGCKAASCDGSDSVVVAAVVSNLSCNCSMQGQAFRVIDPAAQNDDDFNTMVFARFCPGDDGWQCSQDYIGMISDSLAHFINNDRGITDPKDYFIETRLSPMQGVYLSGLNEYVDLGSTTAILAQKIASLLILIVAFVNFANFLLARSPYRIRSVAVRQALGSGAASLRQMLVGEAVIASLCGFILSLIFLYIVQDHQWLQSLCQGSLSLGSHLGVVLLLLAASVAIGVLSGAYPAMFCTSFAPAEALKGSFGLSPRGKALRTVFIAVQMGISFLMVVLALLFASQGRYILSTDYGICKDSLLYANFTTSSPQARARLESEASRIDGVEGVAFSQFLLGSSEPRSFMVRLYDTSSASMMFTIQYCSASYLDVLGLDIVEGRGFDAGDTMAVVITESLRREHPSIRLGEPLCNDFPPVVGVCSDVKISSLKSPGEADNVVFEYGASAGASARTWADFYYNRVATFRVRPGCYQARLRLDSLISSIFPGEGIVCQHYDRAIGSNYDSDLRFSLQIGILAAVAMAVTLVGALCLAMFETECRRKELCVRKILGASFISLLAMLCRRYVTLLCASFALAAPIAYFVGQECLSVFEYRTGMHWWIFACGFASVALSVLLAVAAYTAHALRGNPSDSLRME